MMRIFLLSILLIFSLQAKSLFSNSTQADNSAYIGALKDLVIATQKTRGLTNSYLHGNTAALLLVYNNRNAMKKAIGTMESLPLATDPVINSRSTAISQALIKLNSKAFKSDASEVFASYTEQIEQILMLAQTVNKRSEKELNDFGRETSAMMMETMLPLTEYVGQLRGFGAGLASKGEMSKGELEKLFILISQVKSFNATFTEAITKLTSKYPDKFASDIKAEATAVNNDAIKYTSYAENKFKYDIKSIDADDYFDNGTKLISLIIKAYNSCNSAILEDSKGWL